MMPMVPTLCLLAIFALSSLTTTTRAFIVTPMIPATTTSTSTRRYLDLGSMFQNFGKKVKISHILIGPASSKSGRGMEQDAAKEKLEELKVEIENDEEKFAAAAQEFSSCKSSKEGGDLGEFGPGLLVNPIDEVCFKEEVGIVHGPIKSPFGHHLVLVRERTGGKE